MVKGLDIFREYFSELSDNYIIIGGVACDYHEEANGQIPRATKDIDMILVVEALSRAFVERFWQFVTAAGYKEKQVGEKGEETKHRYYRFNNPSDTSYPAQIELFSRSLDIFGVPEDMHITPIPTDADLSSLSAILMDDDYYRYTLEHSSVEEDIHVANIESLIALKCKAYLELAKAKREGKDVDAKHITKHRNDVFRLVAAQPSSALVYSVPAPILKDIESFCESVKDSLPDANLIKSMGLRRITPLQLFDRLNNLFKGQQ